METGKVQGTYVHEERIRGTFLDTRVLAQIDKRIVCGTVHELLHAVVVVRDLVAERFCFCAVLHTSDADKQLVRAVLNAVHCASVYERKQLVARRQTLRPVSAFQRKRLCVVAFFWHAHACLRIA